MSRNQRKIPAKPILRVTLRSILRGRAVQNPMLQRPAKKNGAGGQVGQKVGATPVFGPLPRPRNPLRRTVPASGVAPTFCPVPRPEDFGVRLVAGRPQKINFTEEWNPCHRSKR